MTSSAKRNLLDIIGSTRDDRRDFGAGTEQINSKSIRLVRDNGVQRQQSDPEISPDSKDWSSLVEGIQILSRHSKEIESQADAQRDHIEKLMIKVRNEIQLYERRALDAELMVQEAKEQAMAEISLAENRAKAAEMRAQAAESWLARVQDAMISEFSDLLDWHH